MDPKFRNFQSKQPTFMLIFHGSWKYLLDIGKTKKKYEIFFKENSLTLVRNLIWILSGDVAHLCSKWLLTLALNIPKL